MRARRSGIIVWLWDTRRTLPPKLIAAIAQLCIEDDQPVDIEHRSGLTSTRYER